MQFGKSVLCLTFQKKRFENVFIIPCFLFLTLMRDLFELFLF